jgi:hypothetical protein
MMLDLEVISLGEDGDVVAHQNVELEMNGKKQRLTTDEAGRFRGELVFPIRAGVREQLLTRVYGSATPSEVTEIVPQNFENVLETRVVEAKDAEFAVREKKLKKDTVDQKTAADEREAALQETIADLRKQIPPAKQPAENLPAALPEKKSEIEEVENLNTLPIKLTKDNFDKEVLESDIPVVAYFSYDQYEPGNILGKLAYKYAGKIKICFFFGEDKYGYLTEKYSFLGEYGIGHFIAFFKKGKLITYENSLSDGISSFIETYLPELADKKK